MYQLKQLLPSDLFLQLSSGELVNRQHIRHFSLTPSGQVLLSTGATTFVSRRCMQQIRKEFLK
ncbi:LytTR family transcriptional regulator [Levilactobacillus brevis]|nr:LytTR family transcriptional regulator [Levilactobacillus brevis]